MLNQKFRSILIDILNCITTRDGNGRLESSFTEKSLPRILEILRMLEDDGIIRRNEKNVWEITEKQEITEREMVDLFFMKAQQ